MKRFNLARLTFYLLGTVVSFVLGVYLAGIMKAGEGQMLAAAAIVLGWGVLAAVAFLICSMLLAKQIPQKRIVSLNWALLFLAIALYGITHYRYLQRQKAQQAQAFETTASFLHLASYQRPSTVQPKTMGIGFFQPNFYEHSVMYFYGGVNLEKSIDEHSPVDSLVFLQTELGFQSQYAPPWLFPTHMKLDYGILMFKVVGIGDEFIKIETNQQTGQYHYLNKHQGRFIPWPEFLLSVFSVEPLHKNTQQIHIKPLSQSSTVSVSYEFLEPLMVEGEWMYVKLVDGNLREQGKGWIRWKDGAQLLITYSLLS